MRRWGSTFVTLWVVFFVPSLIVWGLMLRWSETSAGRFESTWRWTADHLAFPIVFSPLTDWSWLLLDQGTALGATIGFLILTAVWSLMLAGPLVFIGGWWVVIARRLSGGHSTSAITSYTSPIAVPSSSVSASLHAPSRALYLVTIPLALTWNGLSHGLRWVFSPHVSRNHPVLAFVRPIFWSFIIASLVYLTYFVLALNKGEYFTWGRTIWVMNNDTWFGYLDWLRIPRISNQTWMDSWSTVSRKTGAMEYPGWDAYMGRWYREPELRNIALLISARHGLIAAEIALLWQTVGRIFR